jgi:F-type H+-transporting ATPase subunit c
MISTAAIGAGLTLVGTGIGVGLVWMGGIQAMGRQPEMKGALQMAMILGTAFIEGIALFALVICLMKG